MSNPIGTKEWTETYKQGVSDIAADQTRVAWSNNTGHKVTVKAISYNQVDAITGDDTNHFSIIAHKVTAAGVHSVGIGTLTYATSTDHVALVPDNFTLAVDNTTLSTSTSDYVIANGGAIELVWDEVGAYNTTLSAFGITTMHLALGESEGQ